MPRPRETENYAGTIFGAVVGGLLGGPVGAAAVGAGLGALGGTAANPQKPLALKAALARYVSEKGFSFAAMERRSWNRLRVVFGWKGNFFYIDAAVPPNKALFPTVDHLEDALYDAAVKKVDARAVQLGVA
jgi:hypothetical protein